MLWLQLMDVPTLSDDMLYRFMWTGNDGAPVQTIDSLGDLLHSQWVHYMTVNGRFVPHLLAQFFLVFMPPQVLQLLNAVLFAVLLHLCVCWADSRRRMPLTTAVVACFFLFVVFQGVRTALLWGLGALNYLWVLVAVMALLLWMKRVGDRYSLRHYVLSPLALLAGWTHEALLLPLSVAFVAYILANRRQLGSKPVVLYMLWMMAGTALCLLSPGLASRSSEGISMQGRLLSGAINCVSNIRVMWLLLVVCLILWRKNRTLLREHISDNRYVYLALSVAFGIVLLCGTNLERVGFYVDFMSLLLLLSLMVKTVSPTWARRLTVACSVLMALSYVPAWMVRHENSKNWQLAERQMKEPGRKLIAVHRPLKGECRLMDYFREHYVNSSFVFGFYSSYMAFDASDINMRCAARLYGKDRLVFLPEDVVERIKRDATAYKTYELDANKELYVWRMENNKPVSKVRFVLKKEDVSQLSLRQRLMAYKGDSYELDDFHFEVVRIDGRSYLVFTCPTTNIFRRIARVEAF